MATPDHDRLEDVDAQVPELGPVDDLSVSEIHDRNRAKFSRLERLSEQPSAMGQPSAMNMVRAVPIHGAIFMNSSIHLFLHLIGLPRDSSAREWTCHADAARIAPRWRDS